MTVPDGCVSITPGRLEIVTMRDFFAAYALMGLLGPSSYAISPEVKALQAYRLADAMLDVREREGKE